MYKVIAESSLSEFQKIIDNYSKAGYVMVVWEGWYANSWSCVMTNNTDHPRVEVRPSS